MEPLEAAVIDWLVIVGEQPAGPGVRHGEHLAPWWPISKTLSRWLHQAGFFDGELKRIRFWNVFPQHLGSPTADQRTEAYWELSWRLFDSDPRPSVVVTLGREAANAFKVPREHRLDRDCGKTYRRVVNGLHAVGEPLYPFCVGYVFDVLPLPHPSGLNRTLNGAAGQLALSRGLLKLKEMKDVYGKV